MATRRPSSSPAGPASRRKGTTPRTASAAPAAASLEADAGLDPEDFAAQAARIAHRRPLPGAGGPDAAEAGPDEATLDDATLDEAPTGEPEVLEAEVLDAHFGDEVVPDGSGDLEAEVEAAIEAGEGPAAALPVPVSSDAGALAPSDALSRYLAEIRTYPLLSREEEHEIALRYFHDQDADAAVRLVTANLRLVVVVAREYQRAFHNLLDLIQEGNVGLLEAVKQFDPYRGVRFPSYAVWWIRAYVIRYVMNNFRLVKVGTTQAQRRLFFNLRKEKSRLEALGFRPTSRQIADSLGVKEKEVIEMDQRLSASSEVSTETPLGHDSDSGTILDLLPSPGSSAEDDVAEGEFHALMKEKIDEFGATLKGREAEIYRDRLMAEEPVTLQELGDRYGVSRERVRQMEVAVKRKLREYLVAKVRDLDEDMVR